MPAELIWSNQARNDLLEIYVMIGLEQPRAAERYFDRIEAKGELQVEALQVYGREWRRGGEELAPSSREEEKAAE